MKKASIIGFGRFGRVWTKILKDDFEVLVSSRSDYTKECEKIGVRYVRVKEALKSPVIFYAVPINGFERVVRKHVRLLENKGHTHSEMAEKKEKLFIDLLSVKVHPKQIFDKYLPNHFQAMLTHPMFGPDSYKSNKGLSSLPIVLDKFKTNEKNYNFWKNYFLKKELRVIEMTAEEHDKKAAYSQGIAHFLGRVLDEVGVKETEIDTLGAKKLLEIKEMTCNDTWELFKDLQNNNPYTEEMRTKLLKAFEKVDNKLE